MTDARERVATGERVLSLSEVAEILHMKRPNVAKFLARRGVEPAFPKAQGYFWWASDIERIKAEFEADETVQAARARHRANAQRRLEGAAVERAPVPPEVRRLGRTQRELLQTMLRRPVMPNTDATRLALGRLAGRGLVERVPGERSFQLTAHGRTVVGGL